ncbi:MAG: hypothetical protein FWE47_00550 [Oscillospiraceae bacterium]|nr:hypothetical protein [Oscillospiraceae bacterium]
MPKVREQIKMTKEEALEKAKKNFLNSQKEFLKIIKENLYEAKGKVFLNSRTIWKDGRLLFEFNKKTIQGREFMKASEYVKVEPCYVGKANQLIELADYKKMLPRLLKLASKSIVNDKQAKFYDSPMRQVIFYDDDKIKWEDGVPLNEYINIWKDGSVWWDGLKEASLTRFAYDGEGDGINIDINTWYDKLTIHTFERNWNADSFGFDFCEDKEKVYSATTKTINYEKREGPKNNSDYKELELEPKKVVSEVKKYLEQGQNLFIEALEVHVQPKIIEKMRDDLAKARGQKLIKHSLV